VKWSRGVGLAIVVLALGVVPLAHAATSSVVLKNISYQPSSVTIAVGDTVTWTHMDGSTPHSVTADHGEFDSSPSCTSGTTGACMTNGATFSHTFNQQGTFSYHCRIHSFMTGTVTVSAPAPATTQPPATSPPPAPSPAGAPAATAPPTTRAPATTVAPTTSTAPTTTTIAPPAVADTSSTSSTQAAAGGGVALPAKRASGGGAGLSPWVIVIALLLVAAAAGGGLVLRRRMS
jgi:plastocyanin